MILHYLKIAFRNHTKHKIQSIISLLSLAIAFACVSLAACWVHYEETFDSFLPDNERIYKVANKHSGETYPDDTSCLPIPTYLMENYPEVDIACGVWSIWYNNSLVIDINNQLFHSNCTEITPEAVDIFDIQWLKGNVNVNSWKENEIAISEQIAQAVCDGEFPIGLKVTLKEKDEQKILGEYQIVAVYKTRSKHSNLNSHLLKRLLPPNSQYTKVLCDTYVRLHQMADSKLFLQKVASDTHITNYSYPFNVLTPLKEVHYTYPLKKRNIHMSDVKLFTSAAILLSICALLNYLMLFVSRLRNRGRDMALRALCGSSSLQMGIMLMLEYLLLLLGALLFSLIFIEVIYSDFVELAQLEIDRITIYASCVNWLLFIVVLATVLSLIPLFYFKQKTLRVQMESESSQTGKNRFRIAGVCVQLFISMLFIFCASVMIKQIHYLIHADIHIERKNIASLIVADMKDHQIMDILRQYPMITEMVPIATPLFPCDESGTTEVFGFEGNEDKVIHAKMLHIDSDIARFYGLRMKEGDENFDFKMRECLINETLATQLGYTNPVGKTFYKGLFVIKGVVYDFPYQPPTEPVRAVIFYPNAASNSVAFKYSGDFAVCKEIIEKTLDGKRFYLKDGETVYKGYLKSELNLLKLLNIVTVISLLIALFGVYALILQECERQRKNIAIRKVYGAQVKDILIMFFKEYMIQVAVAAAFAFLLGYALMKHWLEDYSRQTSMGIEIFLGIFISMTALVLLCIGWHVWRAANENPATTIKKE